MSENAIISTSHLKSIEGQTKGFSILVEVHVSSPRVHVYTDNVPACPFVSITCHSSRVLGFAMIGEAPRACIVSKKTKQMILILHLLMLEVKIG